MSNIICVDDTVFSVASLSMVVAQCDKWKKSTRDLFKQNYKLKQ